MFKRSISICLSIILALSFAACGKPAAEEAQVPAEVYKSAFSQLSAQVGSALRVKVCGEDGVYASCEEKVGREIPEGADTEGMTEEELTRFDKYATNIYFIGNDGTVTKLPNYEPLQGKENTEDHKDYYSQPGLDNIALDGDGNLLVVEYIYTGWYEGPEGKTYADEDYYDYYKGFQEIFVRKLNSTGAQLSCVPLELDPDQYFRSSVVTDGDGNLLGSVGNELMAYNGEGELAYSISTGDYIESIVKLGDGRIYVTLWGDNGLTLAPVDTAAKTIGKGVVLPNDAYSPIAGGGSYDLYYTSGLNFYGYDIETGTAQPLLNWTNCDVNSENISGIRIADDGTVTAISTEEDAGDNSCTNELLTISKVPYDPAAEKQTLTLACMSLDSNVQNAVIKFNRSSESARIEIKDYSQFNTGEESEGGAQKLLTEIMAGDGADIIALDGLPYRRIAAKGLLEDLTPYLDADGDITRKDIFPNILNALEVNGGLYSVCPSFYVAAVMGAVSVVGDKQSWTYEEFDAALASMPEGCEPFDTGANRGDVLRACLALDMAGYVDWSSGKCSFDSEQFIKLLEFVNRFPKDRRDGDDVESTRDRIRSGKQMLLATSIYSLDDALYDCSYFDGQEVRYIGFPTYSGSGNVLNIESSFAMGSTCKDKDAAWTFLRGFFTEKYQKANVWSIPTNMAAYEYKLAQMTKTNYMIDENGQYVLDENGERIKEPRYTMSSDDGPVVNVYAMTQEQADEVTAVVKATTKAFDYDESIISIVMEQAEAYFAGQKSAQEVAKLVQAKANIYVNEQN